MLAKHSSHVVLLLVLFLFVHVESTELSKSAATKSNDYDAAASITTVTATQRSNAAVASRWVQSISSQMESLVRTSQCFLWSWGVEGAHCSATATTQQDDRELGSGLQSTAKEDHMINRHNMMPSQRLQQTMMAMNEAKKRHQQPPSSNIHKNSPVKNAKSSSSSSEDKSHPLRRRSSASGMDNPNVGNTQALPLGSTFDSIRLALFTATQGPMVVMPPETVTQQCYNGQIAIAVGTTASLEDNENGNVTVNWVGDAQLPDFHCINENNATVVVTAKEFYELPSSNRSRCAVNASHPRYQPQCVCPVDYFLFQTTSRFYSCLPRNVSCNASMVPWITSSCRLPGYAEPERVFDHCLPLYKDTDTANLVINLTCSTDGVAISTAHYSSYGAVVAPTPSSTGDSPVPAWMPVTPIPTAEEQPQPVGNYIRLARNQYAFPHYLGTATATSSSSSSPLLSSFHPLAQYGALELEFFDFNSPSLRNDTRVLYRLTNATNSVLPTPPTSTVQTNSVSSVEGEEEGGWAAIANGFWKVEVPLSLLPERVVAGGRLYLEMGVVAPFGLVRRYSIAPMQIDLQDARFVNPAGKNRSYSQPLDAGTVALIAVLTAVGVGLVLVVIWKLCHREEVGEDDSIRTIAKKQRMGEGRGTAEGSAKKNQ